VFVFGKEVRFAKYYFIFTAIFLAFVTMLTVLSIVFNGNPQGLTFITIFAPILVANFAFVKDNNRNPNKLEKRSLAYGFTLIVIIMNLLVFYVLAFLNPEFISKISVRIVVFAIIVATFIIYFLIILSFWISGRILRKFEALQKEC